MTETTGAGAVYDPKAPLLTDKEMDAPTLYWHVASGSIFRVFTAEIAGNAEPS